MLNLLNIQKPLMVNGVVYENSAKALEALANYDGEVEIRLNFKAPAVAPEAPKQANQPKQEAPQPQSSEKWYRIFVKAYMTLPSIPGFDFMEKYNNNVPMPSRVMVMKINKETKGMYHVSGHLKPEPSRQCIHCGRTLRHKVSILYGIGPICGQHFHINPLSSEAELEARIDEIREKMAAVQWSGWVIKSAILSMEEVDPNEKALGVCS